MQVKAQALYNGRKARMTGANQSEAVKTALCAPYFVGAKSHPWIQVSRKSKGTMNKLTTCVPISCLR